MTMKSFSLTHIATSSTSPTPFDVEGVDGVVKKGLEQFMAYSALDNTMPEEH